jgi:PilZ domain-containing protein
LFEWSDPREGRGDMSVLQKILDVMPQADERRRFQRVRVNLLGRYMLADRREYPCQVQDMSPGGMALVAPVAGKAGERVVAYVDHLGRLEGTIVRVYPTGFAMTIAATSRKRDKLAAQLTWLANRHILGLPEDRRHERIVPRNPRATMVLPDGTTAACRIVDMSLSGAAVASEMKPPVGAVIWLGKTQGRVVRVNDEGFALEFTRLQHPDFLEENVTGP